MNAGKLITELFDFNKNIRYVAIRWNNEITKEQRNNLINTSSAESDFYEEQIVNPSLLLLGTQRGIIDCGGLEYIILSYGHFYQIISTIAKGHISIGIEKNINPNDLAKAVFKILKEQHKELYET